MNQILDRISKALRLGKDNNNEHEAQAAILAAQRLMAKYKISEEEINDFLNENEKQDQDSKVIEENAENETNNDKWKRLLMVTIAKNFRCDVYYHGGKLVIVGAKEDLKGEDIIWLVYGNKNFNPCCGKVIQITEKQLEQLYVASTKTVGESLAR